MIYLINTDKDARTDVPTYEIWFQERMAFAGDHEGKEGNHTKLFNRLEPDDVLFMYHSKVGHVGVAVVRERWNRVHYTGDERLLYRVEPYEYRINVRLVQDWRNSPKREQHGLPIPRGLPWQQIDAQKYPNVLILSTVVSLRMLEEYSTEFDDSLQESFALSDDELQNRLEDADPTPTKVTVLASVYKRNPNVVVGVLRRANGVCEGCNQAAPFIKRSDGSPYLEVHHIVMLSAGGRDTTENAKALCPNCHRRSHHG